MTAPLLLRADARAIPLPDGSVHCCVTSPPYWGLRCYGVNGQLGLEKTPEEYVAQMVAVFREVRRVLRDDGTLWLNLGDCYAGGGKHNPEGFNERWHGKHFLADKQGDTDRERPQRPAVKTLKPKDLVGIPWRVAFALQADGWVLRSDIVWNKPNPMPESVTDRPTKAHEMLFLFSKAKWIGGLPPPVWLPEKWAAWLAALIDGEGTICFQERITKGAENPTWSVRLSACNTNRDLLQRCADLCNVGGGPGAPSPRYRDDGSPGRPVYSWQVTNRKAAEVIQAIRPYLIAKGTQADLALAVHAANQRRKGRGKPATPDEVRFKRKCAEACSALNHGDTPDLSWFKGAPVGRWTSQPYMYDAESVREPHQFGSGGRQRAALDGSFKYADADVKLRQVGRGHSGIERSAYNPAGRNRRTVWTIATQPYSGAHFATFPEKLVEPCILAGTSERGCCPECGAGWVRVVDRTTTEACQTGAAWHEGREGTNHHGPSRAGSFLGGSSTTTGWRPGCDHYPRTGEWREIPKRVRDESDEGYARRIAPVIALRAELLTFWEPLNTVPAVVFDPFCGSGTAVRVAARLRRRGVGADLSREYLGLSKRRTTRIQTQFA